ncbi:unnamed protein product [uncultured virus]|nr:unnamed protein product [uncultured virus]
MRIEIVRGDDRDGSDDVLFIGDVCLPFWLSFSRYGTRKA